MKSVFAAAALILVATFAGAATAVENPGTGIRAAKPQPPHKQARKRARPNPGAHPRVIRTPQPGPFGWRPADPSFDPQGRRYQPPPGLSCPIDLGYGRWASCNDDL